MAVAEAQSRVSATLNFAGDRSNGGIWSNTRPETITQTLVGHEVHFSDARALAVAPTVGVEGFEIAISPLDGYHWDDPDWIANVYMPDAVELVRRVTGADFAAAIVNEVLIRDTGDVRRAPAAQFVHIDQDRGAAMLMLAVAAGGEATVADYSRATIFNVWRSITPPPQDVPLALCDQRTGREADWVIGKTIEPEWPYPIPYVSTVYSEELNWYYYPDMSVDEALIFKNFDNGPGQPFGCLHGAFKLQAVADDAVPRASAETRIAAFFK